MLEGEHIRGGGGVMFPQPIGVFDSGVGGLTVVEKLIQEVPGIDIIYFGDTAHVPYGPRSADQL
ncbi:MAG: hypothetical protein H5U03_09690, partial [Clostridia bacterium]|nr:hypothetical protein [Clostridia bacterium]